MSFVRFWGDFWAILGGFWEHFRRVLRRYWGIFGAILGRFWVPTRMVGNMRETLVERSQKCESKKAGNVRET